MGFLLEASLDIQDAQGSGGWHGVESDFTLG